MRRTQHSKTETATAALALAPAPAARGSAPAAQGAHGSAAPANVPRQTPPQDDRTTRLIPLQLKMTLALLILLVSAVGACGSVFLAVTFITVRHSREEQVRKLGYALASTLGSAMPLSTGQLRTRLTALDKSFGLRFIAVTSPNLRLLAYNAQSAAAWKKYSPYLAPRLGGPRDSGRVRHLGRRYMVIALPIFGHTFTGLPKLRGYVHVAIRSATLQATAHYLEASVLLTCIGVVLLALPVAVFITRHITGPLHQLSLAADTLASGDLEHRVTLERSDEIGALAIAFNGMADTLSRQQEDIRRSHAELENKVQQRTLELKQVNGRLEAEIAEKEDFLRAVSHDLNAPLRNISGMASMLLVKYQATLQADAVQRLQRIQKNVEAECELINELLELSRIKTRREKIELVCLDRLVRDLAGQFSNDLEIRGIALTVERPLPRMYCAKSRLRQVFQNLLDNAIKYMRPDGEKRISINYARENGEILFSVSDTGIGIEEADMAQLFHVFRRARNPAVMKIPGKGVGLASVKSIVETYSGRLWAQSQPGQGTTFYMALPAKCFAPATAVEVIV